MTGDCLRPTTFEATFLKPSLAIAKQTKTTASNGMKRNHTLSDLNGGEASEHIDPSVIKYFIVTIVKCSVSNSGLFYISGNGIASVYYG